MFVIFIVFLTVRPNVTSNKGGPRKQTSALIKKNKLKLVTHASLTHASEPTTHALVTHVYDPTTQTYVEQDYRISKNMTYCHTPKFAR